MSFNSDRPPEAVAPDRSQDRRLRSLLQLGQLIGLDLQLDEMLLQIARKSTEVMEADRFSIFLHNPETDELYTTVALGMGHRVIRIPADSGIAGYCLRTGETVNLENARTDPRLNREAEAETGYLTETLLSMPFYSRAGRPLGVAQALNKTGGAFTEEDKAFLRIFNNHAAVFIEMAQLQKARIEALEQSKVELERLNRAKTKAINHVSHELKTPLAVIHGNVRLLRRRLDGSSPDADWRECMESLEKHLKRLAEIEKETEKIFKVVRELEAGALVGEIERLEQRMEDFSEMPGEVRHHWDAVKEWINANLPAAEERLTLIRLYPFIQRLIEKAKALAAHRDILLEIRGDEGLSLLMAPEVLREVLGGLIRNAIENTPDGGKIEIALEEAQRKVYIHVRDYGIGITEENLPCLFDGLFPARETELYTSKRPYEFGAGGKGLGLLRARLYGERFGFSLSVESRRCVYIPTDRYLCPGRITSCAHCETADDCAESGGSTFSVVFPIEDKLNVPRATGATRQIDE